MRIAKTFREDSWIKFEYYNMNEADAEWATGSEETGGGDVVYVGYIAINILPLSAYAQGQTFVSPGIPISILPESAYSYTFAPIVIPTGEVVEVCVNDVYRITKITKNMGTMTVEITAVKVSEGSEA